MFGINIVSSVVSQEAREEMKKQRAVMEETLAEAEDIRTEGTMPRAMELLQDLEKVTQVDLIIRNC